MQIIALRVSFLLGFMRFVRFMSERNIGGNSDRIQMNTANGLFDWKMAGPIRER